jgi:hypothetical protein
VSAAIKIEISDEPTGDVVHRFRNFGEDIYRELRDTCSVSIDEIDRSTTSFVVRDIHKRHLGVVTQTIKRELRRHHFEQTATLTRV